MTYYPETKKETITNNIKSVFTVIKDEDFKVIKLQEENEPLVIFQIIFKKSVTLNQLLMLGLAVHNPRIMANDEGETLVTFHVTE